MERLGRVASARRQGVSLGHRRRADLGDHGPGAGRRSIRRDATWIPEIPDVRPAADCRAPHARATAVYFPACINRIFGGDGGPSRAAQPAGRPGRAGRACRGPGVDTRRRGRSLLRTVWHSKGYDRGNPTWRTRSSRSSGLDRAAAAAGGGRRDVVHAGADARGGALSDPTNADGTGRSESSTRSCGRATSCSRPCTCGASRQRGDPLHLRRPALHLTEPLARWPRRWPTR